MGRERHALSPRWPLAGRVLSGTEWAAAARRRVLRATGLPSFPEAAPPRGPRLPYAATHANDVDGPPGPRLTPLRVHRLRGDELAANASRAAARMGDRELGGDAAARPHASVPCRASPSPAPVRSRLNRARRLLTMSARIFRSRAPGALRHWLTRQGDPRVLHGRNTFRHRPGAA
jgi:hypothetical protein